ncbi:MAG: hypothetical protein ACYDBQ_10280 [Thermoplasmatota archaeon]
MEAERLEARLVTVNPDRQRRTLDGAVMKARTSSRFAASTGREAMNCPNARKWFASLILVVSFVPFASRSAK